MLYMDILETKTAGYDNTYFGMQAVAYLLDINQWSGFANDKYSEYAIGSPTVE